MKTNWLVHVFWGLHLFAAASPESRKFESFLGCYKDDKARDLKKSGGNPQSIAKCRAWATKKKLKYFAMQWGVACFGDNSFGSPRKKYIQVPLQSCSRPHSRRRNVFSCGEPEFHAYCGGSWVNAVYLTKPVVDHNLKVNKPMQLLSPWKMGWCAYLSNNWNIRMYTCNWGGSQMIYDSHWLFDKKQRMKLWYGRHKGRCWDHHMINNNLYLGGCHNGKNQKWYFGSRNTMHNKWKNRNNCLDWHMGNDNLFMGGCHTGVNQQFWWNTGVSMEIKGGVKSNRKFFTYARNARGTYLGVQKTNKNQQTIKFYKVGKDYYNIKATNCIFSGGYSNLKWKGGYSLDNSYLSVNSQGTTVDIWHSDDGSGRQRWKVKGPLPGGGYYIMIAGGVKGKRKYLSTNSKGTKVDLWKEAGIRQTWKLTGEAIPTPKPTPKPTPRPTPVPVKNLLSGGGWKIEKGKHKCTISIENGVKYPCAVSPNYPKPYPAEVMCEISMKNTNMVLFKGSSEKYFDYFTVSGKMYSGKLSGKKVAVKGNIKWTADFFEATKGWKFCKSRKPSLKVVPKNKKR